MNEILTFLSKEKSKAYNKHKFYDIVTLSIAFITKQVDIKKITLSNFQDIIDESEHSSFWIFLKKYCIEKFKVDNDELKEIIRKIKNNIG